jgi:hypothetical protein
MITTAPQPVNTNGVVSKQEFKNEVRNWVRSAGIEIGGIQIRQLKNRWSSASENRRLCFHSSLLRQPRDFRKQVVLRQLLNLKYEHESRVSSAFFKVFFGNSLATR